MVQITNHSCGSPPDVTPLPTDRKINPVIGLAMFDFENLVALRIHQLNQRDGKYLCNLTGIRPQLIAWMQQTDDRPHRKMGIGQKNGLLSQRLNKPRRNANLLMGLTQCGSNRIGITHVYPPAGKADLAGMMRQAIRTTGEYYIELGITLSNSHTHRRTNRLRPLGEALHKGMGI